MTGTVQQTAADRIGTNALAAMSPAHAGLYREWRGLIEEHVYRFADGVEPAPGETVEDLEERMGAHAETITVLGERILETPVCRWGDLLAYAEVCWWRHWPGIDPLGPDVETYLHAGPFSGSASCDQALGKMLGAVFALARPASVIPEARP